MNGRRSTRGPIAGALIAAASTAGTAFGAPSASDKAAAEALFEQARTLLDSGRTEEACEKFAASQALDAGIGTLLYLGDCFERAGKTASSWATFKQAASMAEASGQRERAQIASVRAAALEPKLSKLTLHPSDALASSDASVTRNGSAVPPGAFAVPTPVDPGPQRIEVTRSDGRSTVTEIVVPDAPGTTEVSLELPPPAVLAESPSAVTTAAIAPRTDAPNRDGGDATSEDGATARIVGWSLGGAGLVAAGIGAYFGIRALSDNDASLEDCRETSLCGRRGLALRESAIEKGNVSTVAFAASGALLVGGVVVLLTAPSGSDRDPRAARVEVTATPALGGAHVGMRGAW